MNAKCKHAYHAIDSGHMNDREDFITADTMNFALQQWASPSRMLPNAPIMVRFILLGDFGSIRSPSAKASAADCHVS